MATNLAIDDALLERARRIGKLRTKKETVTQALTEFIQRRRQRDILKAMGTISFRKTGTIRKTAKIVNLVVDTSVWSLVLRRPRIDETDPHVRAFRHHVDAGDGLFLIGNILQELLDGIRSPQQMDRLLTLLDPFPLLELDRQTYVAAAKLRSLCRIKGVAAGPIDFLIASACCQYGFPLLTADKDFLRIAAHCDLVVLPD